MPKLSRRQAILGACAALVAGVLPAVAVAETGTEKLIRWAFPERVRPWVAMFDGRVYVAWKDVKTGAMWWTKPTQAMIEEVDAYHVIGYTERWEVW